MPTTTQLNGVDLGALKDTIKAVRDNRSLGQVTFNVDGEWEGGFKLSAATGTLVQGGVEDSSRAGKFTMASDEPVALLGTDTATSPAEHLLQALAGCYTVTLTANAASMGIELEGYRLELEMDLDLAGFLGVDPDTAPGASAIRVRIKLEAPNSTQDELQELVRRVEKRSPIRDTLVRPVPVHTELA
ncbi:OsmC family protein [Ornithinimicrobium faecis]|uniref:OsmC family protein n=1 Tax=Ornithinimicrobium faecis TaxID=2934158 RepID=UPI002118BE80|nr:OsmC family protein [Ornithinimicrobium sp. HY1745]